MSEPARPLRPRLDPLDRLRLRLTAWYVGTLAAMLLLIGGGLFVAVAHEIGTEFDRHLDAVIAERMVDPGAGRRGASTAATTAGLSIYLLDDRARPVAPDTASGVIREAARRALADGSASLQAPLAPEQEVRVRARTFRTATGARAVVVAAGGRDDLEDRYGRLITLFALVAAAAVALVGAGGLFLARKSAAPVERAVEGMRRFMSDAGHELRTPVTVVRTEAEVALRRPRTATDDAASFTRIAGEAGRLSSVVDDLFTLARAESGELAVEREVVYLDDIVSDAAMAMGTRARAAGVALIVAEYDEAPVRGSATLLARAVMILLDNAVKYTPSPGLITITMRCDARYALLDVADTGVGISADALPHIFDRFYRSDVARATAAGAGLGLAIARWVAEAHDGTLELSMREPAGTLARLTLPRTDASR